MSVRVATYYPLPTTPLKATAFLPTAMSVECYAPPPVRMRNWITWILPGKAALRLTKACTMCWFCKGPSPC